jgi:hypothetical protein
VVGALAVVVLHNFVHDPVCPRWHPLQVVLLGVGDQLESGQEVDGLLVKALLSGSMRRVHAGCGLEYAKARITSSGGDQY